MNISKKQAEELVIKCANNDRTAQEALYKLFHADMLRVCYSYIRDKDLAKEAFNTAFLKVFQSIKNFDTEKGELGGWIRRIMIFTSIDLCRKELKFTSITAYDQDQEDFLISPAVLDKLYFEDILLRINQLPYAKQTVFNLSVIDGFTHKEIGEQLNISEGTSRWHLAEAKKKLRELLGIQRSGLPKERSNKAQ